MACVLLIDDDNELASFVSATLAESGHEVLRLPSARNAVQIIQAGTFNLLITDIVMPERNGLELLSELREAGVALPILAMSGATEADLFLRMARRLGAVEILYKPFSRAELVAAIDSILKAQRAA